MTPQNSLTRRDFVKISVAGAGALALQGCLHRGSALRPALPGTARPALHSAVADCVAHHDVPGAVALVQSGGRVVFHEAFGSACIIPAADGKPELTIPMTPAHRFDLASLTKVVATTTSIMILRDQGRLDLDDPLSKHLPALATPDKKNITLRHCLTHTSGLPPFKLYYKTLKGREAYLKAIAAEPLQYRTGTRWVYSDLGFILLGLTVEAASGKPLNEFAHERIFGRLGMTHTAYLPLPLEAPLAPDATLAREFAATERCPWRKRVMIGQVHDENAYAIGGVSGHAGLFSSAPDLARFCQMLLNKGELDGVQILSPESVALFCRAQVPAVSDNQCIGWRLRTSSSSTLGFLGPRSFGHTGFTGTTLWLDPDGRTAAVLLTNAVHPDRAKSHAAPVRRAFHGAVVEQCKLAPASPPVKSGLDVLEAEGFARLRGRRVAVVTNQTAVSAAGVHLLDLLAKQPEIRVAAIFSPEHGFAGAEAAGKRVGDTTYKNIPVYSLYGKRRKPTAEMAKEFDVVLYDIQDVGARFYTFIWTLFTIEQFCAESGKPLIVLDRPNPLGGLRVEGPVLDEAFASGVGMKAIPTRYGLTPGELATLYNRQGWLGEGRRAQLEIVKMQGWRRDLRFHQTGLPWVAPSPNIPTWESAAVYPGTCIFEGTRWSEGRGTFTPFEMVGGPGLDSRRLARDLNALRLPGCRFLPAPFTPRSLPAAPEAKHHGEPCGGVFIRVDDLEAFRPVETGLAVLIAMRAQAPAQHKWIASSFDRLLGTGAVRKQIEAGLPLPQIVASWQKGLSAFDALRKDAMLYA